MEKILVIADDFTGASEIAGVGFRLGLPTRLVRDPVEALSPGLTVLDTDTRLLSPQQAAQVMRRFKLRLRRGGESPSTHVLFKKTDSVLRGHVLAELEALLETTGRRSALLVPQNPSRGRTIEAGVYYIGSVRLDQTTFAEDPVYPRRSARVLELLGPSQHLPVTCLTLGDAPPAEGIAVGTGRTVADVRHWAARVTDETLPAGGADFFKAVMERRGAAASTARPFVSALPAGNTLFVCGTASSQREALIRRAKREGVALRPMPDEVFGQCAREQAPELGPWVDDLCAAVREHGRAVIVIPQRVDRVPGIGRRLEAALSAAVVKVLDAVRVQTLLLEGGSTAAALCRQLGWHEFTVLGELASGAVYMRAGAANDDGGQRLVVKPGSYPWPEAVWSRAEPAVSATVTRSRKLKRRSDTDSTATIAG